MKGAKLEVLLIGRSSDAHSRLSSCLGKRGCNCRFAISHQQVFRLVEIHSFDLVLGPLRLDGKSLYPLIQRLAGSMTTLFFSYAVEAGCWWLPALRWGQDCFGAPALRPGEFTFVLDEITKEIRSSLHAEAEIQFATSLPLLSSNIAIPFPRRASLSIASMKGVNPSLAAGKSTG